MNICLESSQVCVTPMASLDQSKDKSLQKPEETAEEREPSCSGLMEAASAEPEDEKPIDSTSNRDDSREPDETDALLQNWHSRLQEFLIEFATLSSFSLHQASKDKYNNIIVIALAQSIWEIEAH